MIDEIANIKNEATSRILAAQESSDLEKIRVDYLGRKGKLSLLTKQLGSLPKEERKASGAIINQAKKTITDLINNQKKGFESSVREWFDPTIPGRKRKMGKLHPTSIVSNEMFDIFKHLGFSIYEGPQIESDKWNFENLNLPKDHPARSLQDALYIDEPEVVLRTHTSSVEARALAELETPFRFVVAGKSYRYENVNASNNAMFYQFQGVALQKGISMTDLKGTLYYFVHTFFGKHRKIRFRCKYYPEVEPSAGLDLDCPFCNMKGCTVCKKRGWLEMIGCGMIHPNMIRLAGYDPKKISGFAFGMGMDRLVMDKFGIADVRSLYNNDIMH